VFDIIDVENTLGLGILQKIAVVLKRAMHGKVKIFSDRGGKNGPTVGPVEARNI
jgi:hypothetical protein